MGRGGDRRTKCVRAANVVGDEVGRGPDCSEENPPAPSLVNIRRKGWDSAGGRGNEKREVDLGKDKKRKLKRVLRNRKVGGNSRQIWKREINCCEFPREEA